MFYDCLLCIQHTQAPLFWQPLDSRNCVTSLVHISDPISSAASSHPLFISLSRSLKVGTHVSEQCINTFLQKDTSVVVQSLHTDSVVWVVLCLHRYSAVIAKSFGLRSIWITDFFFSFFLSFRPIYNAVNRWLWSKYLWSQLSEKWNWLECFSCRVRALLGTK